MRRHEIASLKQSLVVTRDWDTFQAIMKMYRELRRQLGRNETHIPDKK